MKEKTYLVPVETFGNRNVTRVRAKNWADALYDAYQCHDIDLKRLKRKSPYGYRQYRLNFQIL